MQKRIERKLRCELTECELATRAASLADTVTSIDEAQRARKQAAKEWGDVIGGLEERQRDLSRAIRTGEEERLVACVVSYHTPAEATKTITRMDTGEVIEECAMSAEECQTRMFASPAELEAAGQSTVHGQLEASHESLDAAEELTITEAAIEDLPAPIDIDRWELCRHDILLRDCEACRPAEVLARPTIAQAVAAHNALEAMGVLPA